MTEPAVVIVGPPGSGKSTTGRLLATRLGCGYRDVDEDVAAAAGTSVSEIFTSRGEEVFRELEERAVAEALATHDGVLALGAGAVLQQRTRALLRGHTVLLCTVGLAEGVRRTGLSRARPLLAGVNPRATFKRLLEERMPLYHEVATAEVDTDGCSHEQVVRAALAALPGLAARADTRQSR